MPQKVKQEHWCFEIGGRGQGTGVGTANPVIGEHTPNYRRQLWEGEAEMALRGKYSFILYTLRCHTNSGPLQLKSGVYPGSSELSRPSHKGFK